MLLLKICLFGLILSQSGSAIQARAAPVPTPPSTSGPLGIEVRHRIAKGRHLLLIRMKNETGRDLSIYSSLLPWSFPYSLRVVVASPDDSEPVLTRERPIADAMAQSAVWRNSEVLEGEIDLEERFPSLRRELGRSELVLLWAYRPAMLLKAERALSGEVWHGSILLAKD